jgi:Organic solute transporter Ostalpha
MGGLTWILLVSGLLSTISVVLSVLLIMQHLKHYTNPRLQRCIVRILLMVPIYSVDSWLSIRFHTWSLYFDLFRDCYEAYVLYMFFRLLVGYLGGESRLAARWALHDDIKHPWPLCCLPSIRLGWVFFRRCKLGILQFVLIKPLLAVSAVILDIFDLYGDGDWHLDQAYIYETSVANFSVTLSMYFLVLFYKATRRELKPRKPLGKFLCIKLVLFFSFWQAAALSGLEYFGVIKDLHGWTTSEQLNVLNDALLCAEMSLISVLHIFAFDYKEYVWPTGALSGQQQAALSLDDGDRLGGGDEQRLLSDSTAEPSRSMRMKNMLSNFGDVMKQGDVLADTRETLKFRSSLGRKFIRFFDRRDPSAYVRASGWFDVRCDTIAELHQFDRRFCAILDDPAGIIICIANPFVDRVDRYQGKNVLDDRLSNRKGKERKDEDDEDDEDVGGDGSDEQNEQESLIDLDFDSMAIVVEEKQEIAAGEQSCAAMSSNYAMSIEETTSDDDDERDASLMDRSSFAGLPDYSYLDDDIVKQLPSDLVEDYIPFRSFPAVYYRATPTRKVTAIDVISIKRFYGDTVHLRGPGIELIPFMEQCNCIRGIVLRQHLIESRQND